MYNLLLFNNSTKQTKAYFSLVNNGNNLYYDFNVDLDDLDCGEYTYFVIRNDRNDVTYEFKNSPLETLVHTSEGDVLLKDLTPETGLLKVVSEGETETDKPTYRDTNVEFTYYKRKG